MAKTIEAKAVISAADKTGNTFDQIAKKMKGVEQAARSFDGIKGPQKFLGGFNDELQRLKLSERELQSVRKSFGDLDRTLKSSPIGAAHYFRAVKDWQGKTVDHWREVKASVDEADQAHKKFFKNAGHFARHTAGHIVGGFGAVYVAGHAIKSVAEAAGARNREGIREEIAGFSPAEQEDANKVADEISLRHTSLSRTEILEDLRRNTARLGTFDRAKEIAETYAKARVFNRMNGGDEHELEQVVRAAEGAGAANTPEQFKAFLNGFAKARARNADYTGEEFSKDFRAAGAAKYGLGKDYMENAFPVLASHTPGFGVKLATSNSALIGGRMTKASKAAMEKAGLWKDGHLVGEREYQDNPFEWIQNRIKPQLEKQGVKFSEDMSVQDKQTVSAFASKTFSAKNVADMVIASLLDVTLIEKFRKSRGKDIDAVDEMQHRDAGAVWAGVTKQLTDLGVAAANTSVAIGAMDSFADELAKRTSSLSKGDWLGLLPEDDQRILRPMLNWYHGNSPGPIPMPRSDPRRMANGERVPMFPMPDPRRHEGEDWNPTEAGGGDKTVQAELTGSAEVKGEVTITNVVQAGSELLKIVSEIRQMQASLYGHLQANGPGSTGVSSPDAAAPRLRPPTGGGASGDW